MHVFNFSVCVCACAHNMCMCVCVCLGLYIYIYTNIYIFVFLHVAHVCMCRADVCCCLFCSYLAQGVNLHFWAHTAQNATNVYMNCFYTLAGLFGVTWWQCWMWFLGLGEFTLHSLLLLLYWYGPLFFAGVNFVFVLHASLCSLFIWLLLWWCSHFLAKCSRWLLHTWFSTGVHVHVSCCVFR